MSKTITNFFRSNLTKLPQMPANLNIIRKYADEVINLGKAKENIYFLEIEQEQLRCLRSKLRKQEKVLTAKINANKKIIKRLEEQSNKINYEHKK